MALGFARTPLLLALTLLLSAPHHQAAATPLATNASSSSANASTSVTTDGLIGWFSCSALTYYDQNRVGNSLLQNVGWDSMFNPGTDSLNTYAKKAQCAQYQAQLCHSGICDDTQGRTVDVFVKRVLARDQPETKPNVWFFQGGPGYGSPTMEYGMRALYIALEGNVNVYTMDHRGTGRSNPLNCVAAQATTSASPLGVDIDISEFASCAQELQRKYGDMAAFSITSAAIDIASFIAKYQSGSKVYVYGVSYGTALVERLMHLNTPEIVGYVLDGVATTSGAAVSDGMYMSNWDVNFGEVADRFLSLLKMYAQTTQKKFESRDVGSVLKNAMAKLDKDPSSRCAKIFTNYLDPQGSSKTTTKPSFSVRRFLAKLLMSAITREYIPVIIYRLDRCSKADAPVLAYALDKIISLVSAPSEEEALVSTLEYYLIVFSEMWESPTPDRNTLLTRFTNANISSGNAPTILPLYCAFTKDTPSACSSLVNATITGSGPALAYKKDKYWNVAATIPPQASVLIMSGKLDPQTPHKYAERLFKALNGSKKELVAFEYAAHGTLLSATYGGKMDEWGFTISPRRYCGVEVLASYVSGGGDLAKLNRTCVSLSNLDMSNLDPIPQYEYTFLGTRKNMFDGELNNFYYSSALEVPLMIVSAVGGMLLLGLLIYICTKVSNRRAARAQAQWRAQTDALHLRRHSDDAVVTASPTNATPFGSITETTSAMATATTTAEARV